MTRIALLYPAGVVAADLVIERKPTTCPVTCQHCSESIDLSDSLILTFLQTHRACVARAAEMAHA